MTGTNCVQFFFLPDFFQVQSPLLSVQNINFLKVRRIE